jgi:hypothetical protein
MRERIGYCEEEELSGIGAETLEEQQSNYP